MANDALKMVFGAAAAAAADQSKGHVKI